jgi:hypothetical protein
VGRQGLNHYSHKLPPNASPAHLTSCTRMHGACNTSRHTRPGSTLPSKRRAPHLGLVDRRTPIQKRPHALHVSVLAGDVQRRNPPWLQHNTVDAVQPLADKQDAPSSPHVRR